MDYVALNWQCFKMFRVPKIPTQQHQCSSVPAPGRRRHDLVADGSRLSNEIENNQDRAANVKPVDTCG